MSTAPLSLENEPSTKIIEIKDPIRITGPGQMLSRLRNFLPTYDQPDLLCVWLDLEDNAVQIIQALIQSEASISDLLLHKTEVCEKLIIIFRADRKDSAKDLANSANYKAFEPLDVLLVAADKWWSHLCSDIECCPLDGRPLPSRNELDTKVILNRHDVWLQWLNLLNLFNSRQSKIQISADLESELRQSLDDLAIRDCLLNHLAINPDSQNDWEKIFSQLLAGSQHHNNQVLYCLLAAIYFSKHDLTKANFYTKLSLTHDPNYSLSKLMEHGLEINMDCKKIVAAFTHYGADELLRNTPLPKK